MYKHGESHALGFDKHVHCRGVLIKAASTQKLQNQIDSTNEAILAESTILKAEEFHLHVAYVGILPYHTTVSLEIM